MRSSRAPSADASASLPSATSTSPPDRSAAIVARLDRVGRDVGPVDRRSDGARRRRRSRRPSRDRPAVAAPRRAPPPVLAAAPAATTAAPTAPPRARRPPLPPVTGQALPLGYSTGSATQVITVVAGSTGIDDRDPAGLGQGARRRLAQARRGGHRARRLGRPDRRTRASRCRRRRSAASRCRARSAATPTRAPRCRITRRRPSDWWISQSGLALQHDADLFGHRARSRRAIRTSTSTTRRRTTTTPW